MKGAYRSHKGQKELIQSIVAFVDVLGFSIALEDATKLGTTSTLLDKFSRFIETWHKVLHDTGEYSSSRSWEVRVFTDNILISYPMKVSDLDGDFEFSDLISMVSLLQIGAIEENWFLRGGIAVGDMYVNAKTIFGLPLVHAYEAESKLAVQPRVVLADSAMYFVSERIRKSNLYQKKLLKGEDGRFFINYLEATIQNLSEGPNVLWVEQHKCAIEAALKDFAANPNVYRKYVWAARYHNYWCRAHELDHLTFPEYDDLNVLTMAK